MTSKNLKDIRKSLSDRCNKVLLMYRRHCAPAVQVGQVCLFRGTTSQALTPVADLAGGFQALAAVYAVHAQVETSERCATLLSSLTPGGNVTSDVRSHYQRKILSHGLTATLNLLYPRVLAIHDLAPDIGFVGSNGRLKLPQMMRASYAYMVAEGAYLLCKSSSHRMSDVRQRGNRDAMVRGCGVSADHR